jgi:hypothetical protein
MEDLSRPEAFEPSYTVPEFCRAEGFCEGYYYNTLKKLGLIPEELRYPTGNMVRITHRARLAWQQKMMNLPPELATKVKAIAARLTAQGRAAAAKAVASPNHVANRRRGKYGSERFAVKYRRKK